MTALLATVPETSAPARRLATRQRIALGTLAALVLAALAGVLVWPDPTGQDLARFLEPPSPTEPLGRDHLGRSVAGRLAHATALSLLLAVLSVTVALLIGSAAGLLAAWRGGWVDSVLHGVSEVFVALPMLLIVLLFSALADGGLWTLYGGLVLAQWVEYFRLTRARSGVLLAGPAVEAAGLLGLGRAHVVRRHLLPEIGPLLLTLATFGVGTSVLAVSTLGFVNVGLGEDTPELGQMVTASFPYYHEAPWLALAPVLVLGVVVTALLGLGVKEARR